MTKSIFHRRTLFVLLLLISFDIFAQQSSKAYLVEYASKSVILYHGKGNKFVAFGDTLAIDDVIEIPPKGGLVVINGSELSQYIITKSGKLTLGEFINGSEKKKISKQHFFILKLKKFSSKSKIYRKGARRATMRRDIDKIIDNVDSLNIPANKPSKERY